MNAKLVGYRTPTEPPTGLVTRLLRPEPRTIPQLTKGQRIMRRHQEILGADATAEDLHNSMNRHERRAIQAEARQYARAKAKREALKRKRAARKLVEL